MYTTQNGQGFHVYDLFSNGKTVIDNDQGYISLSAVPAPTTWLLWGTGLLVSARRRLGQRREAALAG